MSRNSCSKSPASCCTIFALHPNRACRSRMPRPICQYSTINSRLTASAARVCAARMRVSGLPGTQRNRLGVMSCVPNQGHRSTRCFREIKICVLDGPGLVAARVIARLANEALSALAEGVADAQTIDTAMRLGTNYPQGPLVWAEMLGLDAMLRFLEALHFETGDDRYRPYPYLRASVAARRSILSRAAVQGVPHELA